MKNGSLITLNSIRNKSGDKLVTGDLNARSLNPIFDELKVLVLEKLIFFLVTNTKLREAFRSNLFFLSYNLPTVRF